jgi:hypothetical protein
MAGLLAARALSLAGLDALERLFPGFATELEAAGAVPVDRRRAMPWLNAAGWSGRFAAGLSFLSSSRELHGLVGRLNVVNALMTVLDEGGPLRNAALKPELDPVGNQR